VASAEQAQRLAACDPVLCVDTGMQRFGCPADEVEAVLRTGAIHEAFTHATRLEHVLKLQELLGGRGIKLHAAASSLLDEPRARLDAVRPGLACYRGAVRVTTTLLEVHRSRGPVGYGGFTSATGRHGVIIGGYSNGLSAGVCQVNGQRRKIAEVGMQSAYIEIGESDRAGDEVVLLGNGLSAAEVAAAWGCSEHEALLRMARCSRLRAGA
jgi:alanine racemase